jgi:hypothetical protein
VLDALRQPGGCAFCAMHKKLTDDSIGFVMGPSYMEDDVRMETDRVGFCGTCLQAMYAAQNRLGLGLMLHTHVRRMMDDAEKIINTRMPAPLFKKDITGVLPRLKAKLEKVDSSCYVCDKIKTTFERYIDTFFSLWAGGGEEARLVRSQESFCVPHFIRMLNHAEKLGRGKRDKFLDEILPIWNKMMRELEGDLDWFTQKFDFRFKDEPWKNSKDALPRAIAALGGGDVL